MPPNDIMRMLRNPLAQTTKEADFFALVVAECALYGVPPEALALFRDLHAMLGFSQPIAEKQSAVLSGPTIAWKSAPDQPGMQYITELEQMAFHQRALIAFGGGQPGEMVGRAELVNAMGNIVTATELPPTYQEIFRWAAADTLAKLENIPIADIYRMKKWTPVPDDDVVKPGGRLNADYMKLSTQIRREILSVIERSPGRHPRSLLRPWAAEFVDSALKVRDEAERDNNTRVVRLADQQVATIRGMFPELGSVDDELAKRRKVVDTVIEDLDR